MKEIVSPSLTDGKLLESMRDDIKERMNSLKEEARENENAKQQNITLALRQSQNLYWLCWRAYGSSTHHSIDYCPKSLSDSSFELRRKKLNGEAKLISFLLTNSQNKG